MMKIGVYVGSFNPVHKGHKYIMDFLINNNYLDKIIVIPTMEYWDKTDLINIEHRINMLKFYENENIIVNTSLNKLKYTYEILESLNKDYPNDCLHLIIGADNLINFHQWKNIDKLLNNKVIVINRNGINIDDLLSNYNNKNNFVVINGFKEINISSSYIRNNLIKCKDMLDINIYNYIILNNLYK